MGSGADNRLVHGVDLTGSHSSAGKGRVVSGGVSTPTLTCNTMGGLVIPTPLGWCPCIIPCQSLVPGGVRKSPCADVAVSYLVAVATSLVALSASRVGRRNVSIYPTVAPSVLAPY